MVKIEEMLKEKIQQSIGGSLIARYMLERIWKIPVERQRLIDRIEITIKLTEDSQELKKLGRPKISKPKKEKKPQVVKKKPEKKMNDQELAQAIASQLKDEPDTILIVPEIEAVEPEPEPQPEDEFKEVKPDPEEDEEEPRINPEHINEVAKNMPQI